MLSIRRIEPADNAAVATVIKTVMPEFNCVGEGFSLGDPEVDDMYTAYHSDRYAFYVLLAENRVVGVGGYAPLVGGKPCTCELRKMYLLSTYRGLGGGKLILDTCLAGARSDGFTKMYLETVTAMTDAAAVYKKYGFQELDGPLGSTGHSGCDRFMVKDI